MALAEGVETTEELKTVIMLGADLIQGYYTAKPSGDIMVSIDSRIKNEITEFRKEFEESFSRNVFVAGREGRIQLPKLVDLGIQEISVSRAEATFIDFTISGSPELMAEMSMSITNRYSGRITLENIGFNSSIPGKSIIIDGDSDVTFVVKGSNTFTGGIHVAPGSTLRIEGDGDLTINANNTEFFCIGAGKDSRHGDIIIDGFTGALALNGNGVCGEGIGSGKGGKISVNSGMLIINVPGRKTTAIGNIDGESDIRLSGCDISIRTFSLDCIGVGSQTGHSYIEITDSHISSNIEGKNAMFIGNFAFDDKPVIKDSTIDAVTKSALIASNPERVRDINFLNGSVAFDSSGERLIVR